MDLFRFAFARYQAGWESTVISIEGILIVAARLAHVPEVKSSQARKKRSSGTKPGRIVRGNWIPNDPAFVAQLLKISSSFSPPPEVFVSL
jgi:hypothetical protein